MVLFGGEIIMIKLENEVLFVEMKIVGVELMWIFYKDIGFEYLWNVDSKFWGCYLFVLFLIVGRFVEDIYLVDGKLYYLG